MNNKLANIVEGTGGAFLIAAALITPFLRSWRTKWGATEKEVSGSLPGDDIIANPKWQYTQAITIGVPAEKVWPWLVQMGADRAGWYSYDFVDNGGKPSATEILPEFQQIAPGDAIPAFPGSNEVFIVKIVNRDRSLVLVGPDPDSETFLFTWEFLLCPSNQNQTRLIVRVRVREKRLNSAAGPSRKKSGLRPIERLYALMGKLPSRLKSPIAAFGHYIMQAKQLKEIKRRVEKQ